MALEETRDKSDARTRKPILLEDEEDESISMETPRAAPEKAEKNKEDEVGNLDFDEENANRPSRNKARMSIEDEDVVLEILNKLTMLFSVTKHRNF